MSISVKNWIKLPDNALSLLKYLDSKGKQTKKQLISGLNLPTRVVRYSISRLLDRGYSRCIPNLNDMRSVYYQISSEIVDVSVIAKYESKVAENTW